MEATDYANFIGLKYYEASAKTSEGVDEVLSALINRCF